MEPITTAPARRRNWLRLAIFGLGILALVVVIVIVNVVRSRASDPPLPAGWRDLSPDQSKVIGKYAISQDVPGLIVAAAWNPTSYRSEDGPGGPAQLWRTYDGGQHWQRLTHQPPLPMGASVAMIPGRQGTVLLSNSYGLPSAQVYISHDAGDSWQTIPATQTAGFSDLFTVLSQGIYRGNKLYTIINHTFVSTIDDGISWNTIATFPSSSQNGGVLSIAPDYQAPEAWYRLVDARQFGDNSTVARLEHSADDGKTWSAITTIRPGDIPGLLHGEFMSAQLVTSSTQPNRLCLALSVPADSRVYEQPPTATSTALPGNAGTLAYYSPLIPYPPYLPPDTLFLARSADSGHTWTSSKIMSNGQESRQFASPMVVQSPGGDCFSATTESASLSAPAMSTIWKLPSDGAPMIQPLSTVSHYTVQNYMILPGRQVSSWQAFMVVTADTDTKPNICYQGQPCYSHYDQPHLIVNAASGASS